jgi:putative membrane protein
MALLSQASMQRIEQTIVDIEARTAAELVVVSVGQSASYAEVKLGYALAAAFLAGAVTHLFWPELPVTDLLWLQLLAAVVPLLLLGVPSVLRNLVRTSQLAAAVDQRARLAFLEHAVFATRDRSGVLIVLSELERRVVIMGDAGIHARVQTSGWQAHVSHIVNAIRAGRAEQGLVETLKALGETLSSEFPRREDDINELPDSVRQTPR